MDSLSALLREAKTALGVSKGELETTVGNHIKTLDRARKVCVAHALRINYSYCITPVRSDLARFAVDILSISTRFGSLATLSFSGMDKCVFRKEELLSTCHTCILERDS